MIHEYEQEESRFDRWTASKSADVIRVIVLTLVVIGTWNLADWLFK